MDQTVCMLSGFFRHQSDMDAAQNNRDTPLAEAVRDCVAFGGSSCHQTYAHQIEVITIRNICSQATVYQCVFCINILRGQGCQMGEGKRCFPETQ